jgi:hypothetical protein
VRYKEAKAKNDLDQAATFMCQAAALDQQKYEKKCERARADASAQLKTSDALLATSKFELQQKDYQGAIRDLSKISSGPHKEEAQQLIQRAKDSIASSTPGGASLAAWRAAQAAYQQGDLDAAFAQVSRVRTESLQPQVQQMLTSINMYRAAMNEGNDLAKGSNYRAAKQKYAFAAIIKNNGPGDPQAQAAKMDALLAQQATDAAKAQTAKQEALEKPQPDEQQASKSAATDVARKIKLALAKARLAEQKGDLQAALDAYSGVLALRATQKEALQGKQQVLSQLQQDPQAVESSLENGVRSYYASNYQQANDSLSLYLQGGDLHNAGAAHFYLAASMISQSILEDPHDQAEAATLKKNAEQQFELAKQARYRPVEAFVSPRILLEWNKVDLPQQ